LYDNENVIEARQVFHRFPCVFLLLSFASVADRSECNARAALAPQAAR